MRADMRLQSDDERALRWLKRQLEWEEILAELRSVGGPRHAEREPQAQEPAAA